ncbi:STAS domain-containing protein [Kribbella sp. NPDC051586]|uniref:STAS domain-containing protein n=1 Tax=Kribbella sp. NPDC051586 TaxID=3364118 RepID=UPI00378808BD
MTIVGGSAPERPAAPAAVRLESDAGVVRIVIDGSFSEAASAMAQELLLDACDRTAAGVVLAVEATVAAADHAVLRHLVDVAQRRCWAASCRLEVTAADPDVCEVLAAAGIWPANRQAEGDEGP